MSDAATVSAYDALARNKQRFVDALLSGATMEEAAKAGGSTSATPDGLKTVAHRWRGEASVQAALRERQGRYDVDGTDESQLLVAARTAIEELLQKGAPAAVRVRAAELVYKLAGKLGRRDVRSNHLHLHGHVGAPAVPQAEQERLLEVAMRGRVLSCPCCGAESDLAEAYRHGLRSRRVVSGDAG